VLSWGLSSEKGCSITYHCLSRTADVTRALVLDFKAEIVQNLSITYKGKGKGKGAYSSS